MTNSDLLPNLDSCLTTLRTIGWGAMEILQSYYSGKNQTDLNADENKQDGPVTAADLAANKYILATLQKAFSPGEFGYLSEETHQCTDPLPQDWVWIIDPLDGTRDFIDKTGEYALHIALTYRQRPMLALVGVPEAERLYYAVQGQGCFRESKGGEITLVKVKPKTEPESLTLVVSRSHRDQRFQDLIDRLPFGDRHYVGSVGCKIVTILEGQSDVYISLSGKSAAKDWDFAAPELILTEAGGEFTYFDQTPVVYNRGDVRQWGGILASHGSHHGALCEQAVEILAELDQNN
ncbi:3'(2'),5'-bisphosphate nucleotidase CysQ [Synechocystis sp. PCC 7339]|uniref:3'(2'),5'-bisphosphate nucleotidase CysQ family protein n=1 Tax=unclassified Synechocystis TaxID=2640012 RepID=UPI001BAE8E75|nr:MULTISPECIES: 3'(2'),5'-bisphosphate nucleotidase CysQ [unclassified Synechocystis]QUS62206.1 3'(2'),5'-bisphosphate nucleotidase CysQ [Synechocystis sp. PCC 7338]UAJ71390.1 3'(2'),5'-bisphosphate nucleotidase CysQ [Synechocystis sp. PCC 7339]